MRTIIAGTLALLFSLVAHAGSVLKMDAKDAAGKTQPFETYYAQDGMLRIDRMDAHGGITGTTLVRDGVVWEIDPAGRTYTRVDSASVGEFAGASANKMEAMIASLPPEKRAMMEARMAQMKQKSASTQYTFTDTGRTDHVGSYACKIWEEQKSGQPFGQFCVVPSSSLPGGAELETSLKKATATAGQIIASVPMLAPHAEHITRLGQMNGFPARARISGGDEHVLTSAQAQSLPADKFAIPQGFTERKLGERE
ncbi:MAG: hypothetical protein JSR36_01970 [Proteobacteria bacterium]|nr:hypothetical protein [Pseudomonadota bacterium]